MPVNSGQKRLLKQAVFDFSKNWDRFKIPHIKKKLQKDYNKLSLPVLVRRRVETRSHHWQGQAEMLQIKREWLPGSAINITNSLTFDLHGDWTLRGSENL